MPLIRCRHFKLFTLIIQVAVKYKSGFVEYLKTTELETRSPLVSFATLIKVIFYAQKGDLTVIVR